jgi:hypothetical protein
MGEPRKAGNYMQMETKFLRLRTEVTLVCWFGDWQVCWLGGWPKHRLHSLVMPVKVPKEAWRDHRR